MKTFIANLKYAIRNNESVFMGGGEFNKQELQEVLSALEALEQYEKHGVTCQTYRHKLCGCSECNRFDCKE